MGLSRSATPISVWHCSWSLPPSTHKGLFLFSLSLLFLTSCERCQVHSTPPHPPSLFPSVWLPPPLSPSLSALHFLPKLYQSLSLFDRNSAGVFSLKLTETSAVIAVPPDQKMLLNDHAETKQQGLVCVRNTLTLQTLQMWHLLPHSPAMLFCQCGAGLCQYSAVTYDIHTCQIITCLTLTHSLPVRLHTHKA